MVKTTLPPLTTDAVVGASAPPPPFATDEVIVNVWGMVRVTGAVCVILPPVPVTVKGNVPVGDEEPTVRFSVELPDPGEAIGFGLKVAVTPVGRPEADSDTALLKLPRTVVVIVDVLAAPWAMESAAGDVATVKSGVQFVTSEPASTEPSPVVRSYPAAEAYPVTPGTVLFPDVIS
jgi:hypothetical protein